MGLLVAARGMRGGLGGAERGWGWFRWGGKGWGSSWGRWLRWGMAEVGVFEGGNVGVGGFKGGGFDGWGGQGRGFRGWEVSGKGYRRMAVEGVAGVGGAGVGWWGSWASWVWAGTNEVLDRLKGSLPNTLSVFYPLAGRVKDVNNIHCNDEGVPYVQVKVEQRLEDIVHKATISHQLDELLPPYGQEGYTTLLLAIQINVFACGGIAIGVKMSHAISDAFSLLMFVKTWASMANKGSNNNIDQQTILSQHPDFNIWKLFPPQKKSDMNDLVFADPNSDLIKDRPVTKWFLFRKSKLDELRSRLIHYTEGVEFPSLTMVLSAFIWSRVKAACHKGGVNKTPHELFYSVDVRRCVSPPNEQSYYFGNMVVNALVKPSSSMVIKDHKAESSLWWGDIVRQMKESIRNIISDDGQFIRAMQEGKEDLKFTTEQFERTSKGEIMLLGFSNIQSLPVYEADFGWGKPVWVTSATLIYKDLVILIPVGRSNRDIVAYINLSNDDMANLEGDAEFNAFVSKAPHGGLVYNGGKVDVFEDIPECVNVSYVKEIINSPIEFGGVNEVEIDYDTDGTDEDDMEVVNARERCKQDQKKQLDYEEELMMLKRLGETKGKNIDDSNIEFDGGSDLDSPSESDEDDCGYLVAPEPHKNKQTKKNRLLEEGEVVDGQSFT
ncbi:Salutaridinol 7-O-acetyltransferase [Bienertia sinuspersici]